MQAWDLKAEVRADVFGGYANEAASRTRADREARHVACEHIRGYRVDNDIPTSAIDRVNTNVTSAAVGKAPGT